LNVLGVADIADSRAAFEVISTSIATLVKATNFQDLKALLKNIDFIPLKSLESLSEKDLSSLQELVMLKMETLTSQDIFESQIKVARLINPVRRKRLAAYYTKPIGLKLMRNMVLRYAEMYGHPLILSDPFLGSGLTLSETLNGLSPTQISEVWGIEPHPLSALTAYAAIVSSLKGEYRKVKITVGDSFQIVHEESLNPKSLEGQRQETISRADIILTNPPFTRWEILDADTRMFLTRLIHDIGYDKYVERKQQNLQQISLFIMDYFLKRDGLLVSVLPSSTFYTLYGEAAKALLRDKYWVHGVVDFSLEPSFSIDSGFKEVILIARKRKPAGETAFLTIGRENTEQLEALSNILKGTKLIDPQINWMDISNIPYPWDMNWLTLSGRNPLRELLAEMFSQATKKGTISTWLNFVNKKRIVRGVEMYGPDFFFIPNKYWKIVREDAESVTVEDYSAKMKLTINKEFTVPALRKPELYIDSIIPAVQHYFLSIPPKPESELPWGIAEYIRWGRLHSTAKPAVKRDEQYWYSHVNKQINVKKPFGRVFLPDKMDPSFCKRGIFTCYSDEPLTASKNFYIATFSDKLKDKALSLWFNSSLFIAYFLVASRKISERWTRFLEEDYLRMPVINVDLLDELALQRLERSFDKMTAMKLPSIQHQLGKDYRVEMDETLFEITGILDSIKVHELHSMLEKSLPIC